MKFTNKDSVVKEIDVPTEGFLGLWDIRLYCAIGDKRAYSQVYKQKYIPLIFSIKNTISQEIER